MTEKCAKLVSGKIPGVEVFEIIFKKEKFMDLITFLVGIVFGVFIAVLIVGGFMRRSVGVLRVDNSDRDGPYLFLELNKSVHEVAAMKTVRLKVKCEDFIPHE